MARPATQRGRGAIPLAAGLSSLMLAGMACSYVTTPRAEDAPALHDFTKSATNEPRSTCDHPVDVLEPAQLDEGRYTTVGTISATCYPGSRTVCERSLKARACELGADVVVILPSETGGVPVGASRQSLSSMTARALRLKATPGGRADAG